MCIRDSDIPDVMSGIESGDFATLFEWLDREIYCKAAKLTTGDLLAQATGEAANPAHFLDYVRSKYLPA